MTGAFLAGVVAGYGVAVPVGAIAALIVGLSARTSLRVGAAAALGVATADGVFALAAVVGGVALAEAVRPIAGPLRWLAALVLLVMAVRTSTIAVRRHRARTPESPEPPRLATPARAYGGLLALTMLNPATIVYFAALVIGRQADSGPAPAAGAIFVLGVLLASASWQLVLAGGGSLVGRVLTGPRGRLLTAVTSSMIILVLAGYVLLAG